VGHLATGNFKEGWWTLRGLYRTVEDKAAKPCHNSLERSRRWKEKNSTIMYPLLGTRYPPTFGSDLKTHREGAGRADVGHRGP
jgi:hypothetical protein